MTGPGGDFHGVRTERQAIARVYLAGVSAGIAVGRFVPLESSLKNDLHLSLSGFGWLVSTITLVAACAGLPAGGWIRNRDPRRVLAHGLAIMCAAGAAEAASPSQVFLYGARITEGTGYLLVVITGPVALASRCSAARYRRALALWSTFIPVGLAIALVAGVSGNSLGWRLTTFVTIVPGLTALALILAWLKQPGETATGQPGWNGIHPPVVWLSAAFCLVALIGVAVLAYLPNLAAAHGVGHAVSGITTAGVSLASVPGGMLAGSLMSRAKRPGRLAAAALLMPLSGAAVFTVTAWWAVSLGAGTLMAANGLTLAVMYATMPTLAQTRNELLWGYSLLVQAGSLGTLLGPPLLGYAVAHAGWNTGSFIVAVITAAGLAMFARAARTCGPGR